MSWDSLLLKFTTFKDDTIFVNNLRAIIEKIVTIEYISNYLNRTRFIILNKKPTLYPTNAKKFPISKDVIFNLINY